MVHNFSRLTTYIKQTQTITTINLLLIRNILQREIRPTWSKNVLVHKFEALDWLREARLFFSLGSRSNKAVPIQLEPIQFIWNHYYRGKSRLDEGRRSWNLELTRSNRRRQRWWSNGCARWWCPERWATGRRAARRRRRLWWGRGPPESTAPPSSSLSLSPISSQFTRWSELAIRQWAPFFSISISISILWRSMFFEKNEGWIEGRARLLLLASGVLQETDWKTTAS